MIAFPFGAALFRQAAAWRRPAEGAWLSVATLAKPPAVTVCREGQSGIPRPPVIARPRLPIRKVHQVSRPATAFPGGRQGPGSQRWQHGQASTRKAPRRPGCRRGSCVGGADALRFAIPPLITDAHVRAAERFANDYLLGIEGVRLSGGSSSCDAHDIAWADAKAVTAHNEVVDWINPGANWLRASLFPVFSRGSQLRGDERPLLARRAGAAEEMRGGMVIGAGSAGVDIRQDRPRSASQLRQTPGCRDTFVRMRKPRSQQPRAPTQGQAGRRGRYAGGPNCRNSRRGASRRAPRTPGFPNPEPQRIAEGVMSARLARYQRVPSPAVSRA